MTQTAAKLRWTKAPQGGYYADSTAEAVRYFVRRIEGSKSWEVQLYRLEELVPGLRVRGEDLGGLGRGWAATDTKALAQEIAAQHAALGPDYLPSQHGGAERMTTATLRAYDATA